MVVGTTQGLLELVCPTVHDCDAGIGSAQRFPKLGRTKVSRNKLCVRPGQGFWELCRAAQRFTNHGRPAQGFPELGFAKNSRKGLGIWAAQRLEELHCTKRVRPAPKLTRSIYAGSGTLAEVGHASFDPWHLPWYRRATFSFTFPNYGAQRPMGCPRWGSMG